MLPHNRKVSDFGGMGMSGIRSNVQSTPAPKAAPRPQRKPSYMFGIDPSKKDTAMNAPGAITNNPLSSKTPEQNKATAQKALNNANASNVITPPSTAPINPYSGQSYKGSAVKVADMNKEAYLGALARLVPMIGRYGMKALKPGLKTIGRNAGGKLKGVANSPFVKSTGAMEAGSWMARQGRGARDKYRGFAAANPRLGAAMPYLAAGGAGYAMGGGGEMPSSHYGTGIGFHQNQNPYAQQPMMQNPYAQQPYSRDLYADPHSPQARAHYASQPMPNIGILKGMVRNPNYVDDPMIYSLANTPYIRAPQ